MRSKSQYILSSNSDIFRNITLSTTQSTLEFVVQVSQFLCYMAAITNYSPQDSKGPALKSMKLLSFSSPPAGHRNMVRHNISISVETEGKLIVKREMSHSPWFCSLASGYIRKNMQVQSKAY